MTGIAVAWLLEWSYAQLPLYIPALQTKLSPGEGSDKSDDSSSKSGKKAAAAAAGRTKISNPTPFDSLRQFYLSKTGKMVRFGGAIVIIYLLLMSSITFVAHSKYYAKQISQPSLMFETRLNNGEHVIIDDYVKGYEWIKKNTPQDSRVLSWWDYGYQIAGIANRTTLADGNTWNLEHIALIGKILTSSQEEAHKIARHLADYVLVWAGGGGGG